ncbi:ribonuclease T(2) [Mycolicibacterium sp. CH28]|uniref:ribonuclease T2 family protein n=1 Tax=Mycolicibacterium sp. CH28 TaxID=2512237 RepID=UPI001081D787|nr:ribonuclease T(2) [Mycolicibacterium sp. CH28]TGD84282.1 ribonuclease T(2) [Mycolicibacterium sp. CH28]
MRRSHRTVLSAVVVAVVIAAIVVAVRVVDRPPAPSETAAPSSDSSLLVVTWGPSLCKIEPSNPGCRSGHVADLGSTLILHGLWPQPSTQRFCGVPKTGGGSGTRPPALGLPQDVQADLRSMMSDVAIMAPHEWSAHGTCSGLAPADYFGIAATLTKQLVNILDPVFQKAEGGRVSLSAVRARFETELGGRAGERVGMQCRQVDGTGVLAYEVRLSLPPVAELQAASKPVSLGDVVDKGPAISAGCGGGLVPRAARA